MDTPDLTAAQDAARKAGDHPVVEYGARLGYAASGLMHLLIAYIAVRLATKSGGGSADQSGALQSIAQAPGGTVLLWVCASGFLLLALWQFTEAIARFKDAGDRIKAFSKGVMYVALCWTAAKFAMGSGTSSSGQSKDFTADLMSHTGGRTMVFILGLVVIAIGAYHVYKGLKKKFAEDLQESPPQPVSYAAMIGYAAKGIALAIVGLLFCVASVQRSPGKAGGLDSALKNVQAQPFGTALLILIGLGIGLYGVYSFARAKYARV